MNGTLQENIHLGGYDALELKDSMMVKLSSQFYHVRNCVCKPLGIMQYSLFDLLCYRLQSQPMKIKKN